MWKQNWQLLCVDLPSHSVCPDTAKPRSQHRRTHRVSPPRASRRNCSALLFSNCTYTINPVCISLISPYLRDQRLRNKTDILGQGWHKNAIFLGKKTCVHTHRHAPLTMHCTLLIWTPRNVLTYISVIGTMARQMANKFKFWKTWEKEEISS